MNKEELEQCGCWFDDTGKCITDDIDLNEFAKLVAEREREECANMIEDLENIDWNIWDCAKAIRERGQE